MRSIIASYFLQATSYKLSIVSKDYYALLGISKNATPEEVKSAFRRLAHQHHPDKAGGDEKKFKEINEAYQVLSDAQKRAQYDQYGQTFEQAQANGGGGFGGFGGFGGANGINMDDLGEMFQGFGFGDIFGGGRSRGGSRERSKGRDLAVELTLSFKEMAFGAEKSIHLSHRVTCSVCSGTGGEPGSANEKCKECGGAGQKQELRRTFFGQMQTMVTCGTCDGLGTIITKPCKHCRSVGFEEKREELVVTIPAGMSDGQTLRLNGKGDAGGRGAKSGDLYVTIHVEQHRGWERDGDDIHSTAKVRLATALLGGEIDVETLDGVVQVKIPEGAQHGQVFRLKGKGITHLQRGGRADHYVHIEILIPSRLSRSARKTIEEIKADL